MIDPIRSKSPIPLQSFTPLCPTPISNFSTSSLCSMARPNLIIRFFTVILEWVKWIFCCKSPPSEVISPQLDPSQLPSSDPFINNVFENSAIRNKEKYMLARNIFKTLGSGGPWHWYWNRGQLVNWQKELEKLPLNPFEFLYFLFHDQEMTAAMVSFYKHGATGTATMICALIGRKNPWEEFIEQESKSFAAHGLPEMIPGFCTLLKLDQSTVSTFFNNKQWPELILYLLEERKKYFN